MTQTLSASFDPLNSDDRPISSRSSPEKQTAEATLQKKNTTVQETIIAALPKNVPTINASTPVPQALVLRAKSASQKPGIPVRASTVRPMHIVRPAISVRGMTAPPAATEKPAVVRRGSSPMVPGPVMPKTNVKMSPVKAERSVTGRRARARPVLRETSADVRGLRSRTGLAGVTRRIRVRRSPVKPGSVVPEGRVRRLRAGVPMIPGVRRVIRV